jgi:hypothetical protein
MSTETVKEAVNRSTGRPRWPRAGTLRLPRWQRVGVRYLAAVRRVEGRFGLAAAALLVALTAEAISFFFAATWTSQFMHRYTLLVENPFVAGNIPLEPEYRMRILGPVISWLLGLHGVASTLVPAVANIPLLALLYAILRRRTSRKAATLGTLLMATTHLTMTSRTLLGYQDTLGFLLILAAMAVRNAGLGAVCLFFPPIPTSAPSRRSPTCSSGTRSPTGPRTVSG